MEEKKNKTWLERIDPYGTVAVWVMVAGLVGWLCFSGPIKLNNYVPDKPKTTGCLWPGQDAFRA